MFENLITLQEYLTTTPLTDLFSGTQIDSITQDLFSRYFQFRYLCDEPEKFKAFVQRTALTVYPQYYQYLRIQTTEIDPMVSEYLEREITRAKDSTDSRDSTSRDTSVESGTLEHNGKGKDLTEETVSATDKSSTTQKGTTAVEKASQVDSSALVAATPDSSVYPESGYPEALSWQYVSSQNGSKTTGSENQTTTTTDDSSATGENTGTRSQTYTAGSGYDDVSSSDRTTNGSKSETGSAAENENVKERQTGRHEAPQDMLDRARTYILNTNAYKWLISQFDKCFMSVYDV